MNWRFKHKYDNAFSKIGLVKEGSTALNQLNAVRMLIVEFGSYAT